MADTTRIRIKAFKRKNNHLKVLKMSFEKEQPKLLGKKTFPKEYVFIWNASFQVCVHQTNS